jgi:hypothetical protein
MPMNDVMGKLRKLSQALSRERQSPDWRLLKPANREIGVPGVRTGELQLHFSFL